MIFLLCHMESNFIVLILQSSCFGETGPQYLFYLSITARPSSCKVKHIYFYVNFCNLLLTFAHNML